jgi:hypothetical protein
MSLIKSKINSLAWLKSAAIYISVFGGLILSSKPASAAALTFREESATALALVISENGFASESDTVLFNGTYWNARFNIVQVEESILDTLTVTATLQHKSGLHVGDNRFGEPLNLIFRIGSMSDFYGTRTKSVLANDVSNHLPNDSDRASGILEASVFSNPRYRSNINSWTLRVNADHESVPEPLTILGTATGLGYGALFKRKYSKKKKS